MNDADYDLTACLHSKSIYLESFVFFYNNIWQTIGEYCNEQDIQEIGRNFGNILFHIYIATSKAKNLHTFRDVIKHVSTDLWLLFFGHQCQLFRLNQDETEFLISDKQSCFTQNIYLFDNIDTKYIFTLACSTIQTLLLNFDTTIKELATRNCKLTVDAFAAEGKLDLNTIIFFIKLIPLS